MYTKSQLIVNFTKRQYFRMGEEWAVHLALLVG